MSAVCLRENKRGRLPLRRTCCPSRLLASTSAHLVAVLPVIFILRALLLLLLPLLMVILTLLGLLVCLDLV